MFKAFLDKINDVTHLHKRAAFSDIQDRIAAKESVFQSITKDRFSCHSFKDTPLTPLQVQSILEAARRAPSAMNKQPVHIWVIQSAKALAKLGKASGSIYEAPTVFMVGCKPENAWVRENDGKNQGEIDASIAATHMMLEAAALGLGSLWVPAFNQAVLKEEFPETEGHEIVCLMPVGLPNMEATSLHSERKPLTELVTNL